MKSHATLWPGVEVTVEDDGQWVESALPASDPDWRFIDSAGHGHFSRGQAQYPTLRWVSEPCSFDHEDCNVQGHFECWLCGEVIVPGTKMRSPEYVSGVKRWTVTIKRQRTVTTTVTTFEFSQPQWEQFSERVSDAIDTAAEELGTQTSLRMSSS